MSVNEVGRAEEESGVKACLIIRAPAGNIYDTLLCVHNHSLNSTVERVPSLSVESCPPAKRTRSDGQQVMTTESIDLC